MDFLLRKIIHIDMDAFYASVEQRDNPKFKGKAIAVGGNGQRGVVATASYEAREFGVKSAMPSFTAYRKCPHIIFVKPRFEVYKKVSQQIREIFYSYTDLVEPLSLDEAYLDVTNNKKNIPSATIIAQQIRSEIKNTTGLTASAGISINKFLAKVASDINKPDGITLIKPKEAEAFIEKLEIEKFHGIGKVTAKRMHAMGIHHGVDLKKLSKEAIVKRFGKVGRYFYNVVRVIDNRPVTPHRAHKSIGAERTLNQDISDLAEMTDYLEKMIETIVNRINKSDLKAKTITLKVKYHDFQQITRSKTLLHYTNLYHEIKLIIEQLLITPNPPEKPVRLLGVSASHLINISDTKSPKQLTIPFNK